MPLINPNAPPSSRSNVIEPTLYYDGHGEHLFRLFVKLILLDVLTLGLYQFWGTARLRRYVWSHFSLGDSRFEYSGHGIDPFLAFMAAMLVVVPFVVALHFIRIVAPATLANTVMGAGVFAGFAILPAHIKYSSLRYQVRNTVWQGLHGHLGGSALFYALMSLMGSIFLIISLGAHRSTLDSSRGRYQLENFRLGEVPITLMPGQLSLPPSRDMRRAFRQCSLRAAPFMLLLWGGVFFTAKRLYITYLPGKTAAMLLKDTSALMEMMLGIMALMLVARTLTYLISQLAYAEYHLQLLKEKAKVSQLGLVHFELISTIKEVRGLYFGNALIMGLTLGLGGCFVQHRLFGFYAKSISITYGHFLQEFTQKPDTLPRSAGDILSRMVSMGVAG